jgi:hypothetical protein
MNNASHGICPDQYEFPNYAGETKVVSSFRCVTSFYAWISNAQEPRQFQDSPSVRPAAGMNLPRISCVALLLNPTMTTPLNQFYSCMNPMAGNKRTSNLLSRQFSRRDESARVVLRCPACLHEILRSLSRRNPGMNHPLVRFRICMILTMPIQHTSTRDPRCSWRTVTYCVILH